MSQNGHVVVQQRARTCARGSDQDASADYIYQSRKNVLRTGGLVLVSKVLEMGGLVESAQALPGFKKDLTNKRRIKEDINLDLFKEGPSGLKYYDVVVGDGAEAKLGSRVAVHFDAKWKGVTFVTSRQGMGVAGGSPLGFDVGAAVGQGGTLKGLDLGVRGMRIGGQRKLLVPPNLAYGSKGYGEIPPNASLLIDVQLLSIKQNAIGTQVKLVEG